VACGGGGHGDNKAIARSRRCPADDLELPRCDQENSRAVGGAINASNVSTLGVAWTVPITATSAFGGYSATRVVVNGVLYTQDSHPTSRRSTSRAARSSDQEFNSANEGRTA